MKSNKIEIYCKICNQKTNLKGLSNHIKHSHKNISLKEYYDTYINFSNHKCRCGKNLKFKHITTGYTKTCGDNKCKNLLYEEARLEKTGYRNSFQDPKVKLKRKETWIKNYGVDNPSKSLVIKEKIRKKTLDNYKDINFCNKVKEKSKKKKLEKYGDENYSCYGSDSFKKLMLSRYGEEHYTNKNQIKKSWSKKTKEEKEVSNFKRMETMLNRYNVLFGCQLQNSYSKVSQKLFWEIYEKLPKELKSLTYFAELNYEFMIGNEYEKRIYLIDFAIPKINFCLEFYGDYWHKNPKIFKHKKYTKIWKQNYHRENMISQEGYFLYKIWELQYRENKDFWIQEILFHINILKENFLND